MTSYPLFTGEWWKAAGVRAARTAIVIALPYVAASSAGALPWVTVASAVALGVILSLVTSLAGLAELQPNKQNYAVALLTRVVKTVAQALVTAIGTTVFITDVDWAGIASLAFSAGLGSLLMGLLSVLPEAAQPAVAASVTVDSDGETTETQVPVVATVEVEESNEGVDLPGPDHRAGL